MTKHIKSLLFSNHLAAYIDAQNILNFNDCQQQLESQAAAQSFRLSISADQAAFLTFLTRLLQPKKVIEIGSFQGFSTLAIAKAMPASSQLICLEKDPNLILTVKQNLATLTSLPKLNFYAGPALDNLTHLLEDKLNLESVDFAFVDADKPNNYRYFELLLPLMKKNGAIIIDNAIPADYKTGEFLPDNQDRHLLVKRIFAHPLTEASLFTIGAGFLAAIKC